ncbi:MAG: hypothetical protein ACTTG9_06395 [Dialister pneumosintes]
MEISKSLIKSLTGYSVKDEDKKLLEFIYNSEKQHILNDCNLATLPDELLYIVEERSAGLFMSIKTSDILGADSLDVVTSIKEGDTTVEIGGVSAEERLSNLANKLMASRERDIACYRKLKW